MLYEIAECAARGAHVAPEAPGRHAPIRLRLSIVLLAAVSALLASTTLAKGDSYYPMPEQRVIDPTGSFYALVRRLGRSHTTEWGPVVITIAQRSQGRRRVAPLERDPITTSDDETGGLTYTYGDEAALDVLEGDRTHGAVKIDDPPLEILVSSKGRGIVLLDAYGHNMFFSGDTPEDEFPYPAIRIVSLSGRIKHTITVEELFSADIRHRFETTTNRLWWLRGAWIDERRGEVVIVGNAGVLRVVSMRTGKVRNGCVGNILDVLFSDLASEEALKVALEVAAEGRLETARGRAIEMMTDRQRPWSVRLRAANLLAALGDSGGIEFLRNFVERPAPATMPDDIEYARHRLDILAGGQNGKQDG